MSQDETEIPLARALKSEAVLQAGKALRQSTEAPEIGALLDFARALAAETGDEARAQLLGAELSGYDASAVEVPERRRVAGYASPFPVRAIGLLDPEEIFLANRDKFAQVSVTIGQSIGELRTALEQIQEGGVLALRVPATEISGEAASLDGDAEVYIYILPREIERVVEGANRLVLDALLSAMLDA